MPSDLLFYWYISIAHSCGELDLCSLQEHMQRLAVSWVTSPTTAAVDTANMRMSPEGALQAGVSQNLALRIRKTVHRQRKKIIGKRKQLQLQQ